MGKKKHGFAFGAFLGAGIGALAGILLAPRSGEESRKMVMDAANDVTDKALDAFDAVSDKALDVFDTAKESYEQGAKNINRTVQHVRPVVAARTDELRAKVELAKERMDQVRSDLSATIDAASTNVNKAVDDAVEYANKKEQATSAAAKDAIRRASKTATSAKKTATKKAAKAKAAAKKTASTRAKK